MADPNMDSDNYFHLCQGNIGIHVLSVQKIRKFFCNSYSFGLKGVPVAVQNTHQMEMVLEMAFKYQLKTLFEPTSTTFFTLSTAIFEAPEEYASDEAGLRYWTKKENVHFLPRDILDQLVNYKHSQEITVNVDWLKSLVKDGVHFDDKMISSFDHEADVTQGDYQAFTRPVVVPADVYAKLYEVYIQNGGDPFLPKESD